MPYSQFLAGRYLGQVASITPMNAPGDQVTTAQKYQFLSWRHLGDRLTARLIGSIACDDTPQGQGEWYGSGARRAQLFPCSTIEQLKPKQEQDNDDKNG